MRHLTCTFGPHSICAGRGLRSRMKSDICVLLPPSPVRGSILYSVPYSRCDTSFLYFHLHLIPILVTHIILVFGLECSHLMEPQIELMRNIHRRCCIQYSSRTERNIPRNTQPPGPVHSVHPEPTSDSEFPFSSPNANGTE